MEEDADQNRCQPADRTSDTNTSNTINNSNGVESGDSNSNNNNNSNSNNIDNQQEQIVVQNPQDVHTREKLFDFIALLQGRRMDDQRAILKPSRTT